MYSKLHILYSECKDKVLYKKSYDYIRASNYIIGLLSIPYAGYLITR